MNTTNNLKTSAPKNITIVGTGYVGLVSAAVFADWGHKVICLDINPKKIEMIKNGEMPIYEDGLKEVVDRVQSEGNFIATTDYKQAIEHGDYIFICVGTPSNQSGSADLSYVFDVAKAIGEYLKPENYKIIVTKSTVPVGTNKKIENVINETARGLSKEVKFDVASNPEFLREGSAIWDANNPDRVVLGSKTDSALNSVFELYAHLQDVPFVKTSLESAELIKYASNAFLATKISFINEIAQVCERTGANVREVAIGMGYDKRIGDKFLNAGIGYGGSCFPKDVEALYKTSSEYFYDFRLLRGVMDTNERQKHYFLEKVFSKYGDNLSGKTLGILGAAFKNNTDDVRKSVALEVIKILRGAGAQIKLFDPAAMEHAKHELGDSNMIYCNSGEEVFDGSDALFILTEWKEFKDYDYANLLSKMKDKVIFDGRNLLDIKTMRDTMQVEYHAIG